MKLYATVTSERATKGQGGNDYLDIRLSVSNDRIEAGRIIVEPSGTGYKVYFIPPAGITKADGVTLSEITAEYIEIKKKGEKQKGEYTYLTSCIDCKQRLEGTKKRPLDNVQCRTCGKVQ